MTLMRPSQTGAQALAAAKPPLMFPSALLGSDFTQRWNTDFFHPRIFGR